MIRIDHTTAASQETQLSSLAQSAGTTGPRVRRSDSSRSETTAPDQRTSPCLAAAFLYAVRSIRERCAGVGEPGEVSCWHCYVPVNWDRENRRLLQAQIVEQVVSAAAITAHDFLTLRHTLGLTYYYGEPTLSERAADAIDEVQRRLAVS